MAISVNRYVHICMNQVKILSAFCVCGQNVHWSHMKPELREQCSCRRQQEMTHLSQIRNDHLMLHSMKYSQPTLILALGVTLRCPFKTAVLCFVTLKPLALLSDQLRSYVFWKFTWKERCEFHLVRWVGGCETRWGWQGISHHGPRDTSASVFFCVFQVSNLSLWLAETKAEFLVSEAFVSPPQRHLSHWPTFPFCFLWHCCQHN